MQVMTIGYEGSSFKQFVDTLAADGVEKIVDVRELPLSRKRGFSKRSLEALLHAQGIEYIHLRELGCPRPIRYAYRADGNWPRYTVKYLRYLDTQDEAMQELYNLASRERCALLCFEADANRCHRSLVVQTLRARWNPRLEIRHLTTNQITTLA
jgi:uncharacterized protein (DUF488 family)